MNVLIYASRYNGASRRLLESVRDLNDSHQCMHFDELTSLVERLHRSRIGSRIAVLFPSNCDELARLVALRDMLFDMQVILILPNWQSQTLSHGHTLRPRFISHADSDFTDVAAVYEKILTRLAHHPTANA